MTAPLTGIGGFSATPASNTALAGDAELAIDFAALLVALGATPNEKPPDAAEVPPSSGDAEAAVEEEELSMTVAVMPSLDALPWQPPTPLQQGPPTLEMQLPPALPAMPGSSTATTTAPTLPHAVDGDARTVQEPLSAAGNGERPRDAKPNEAASTFASHHAPTTRAALMPDTNTMPSGPAIASALPAADPAAPAHFGAQQLETPAAIVQPFAAPLAAQPGAPAAPAPTLLTIATPLASPDFAAALSAQLSVLARDGVQHAELRLNPSEMGPIAVRIDVANGTNATVHFAVDVPATREVLEAGLPELAGALREAGLTLVGGGVSDASAQRHRHDDNGAARDAQRRDGNDDGGAHRDDGEPAPVLLRRARGVVDLIA